jgi:hypothetical protein
VTLAPFLPIGDKARWRIVYDMLRSCTVNGVITYPTLGAALDLDPEIDRHAIQMAMRRAAKEHEENDMRAIESVPNVGYRVVEAAEHMRLAKGQQRRARGALMRGQSKVVNVDFNQIDGETRKAFELVAQAFQMQVDMTRRLSVQGERLKKTIDTFTAQQSATNDDHSARLAKLEEVLRRHGIAEGEEPDELSEDPSTD